MTNDLISIIIPTYNAEDTIERCINSVLRQTHKNLEIIVVDDGSTDKTVKKLSALNNEKINILSTENHGAAHARNLGLSKCGGVFVFFVDSDDEINSFVCEKLYKISVKTDADLVFCNLTNVYDDGRMETLIPFKGTLREFEGENKKDLQKRLISKNTETGDSLISLSGPVCKLVRGDLARKYKFPEHIALGEDTCYIIQLIEDAHKVVYTNESLYLRHITEGSASSGRMNEDLMLSLFTNWVEQFCDDKIEYLPYARILNTKNMERVCYTYFKKNNISLPLAVKHIKKYISLLDYNLSTWEIISQPISAGYKMICLLAKYGGWRWIERYYKRR